MCELWKLINYLHPCIFTLVPCPVSVGRTLLEGITLVGFTVEQVDGAVAKIVADALPETDEGADPALPGYRRKQGRFR